MPCQAEPVARHLEIAGALDRAALARIRDAMSSAAGDSATVLGAAPERIASSARRATLVEVPAATREEVERLLGEQRPRMAAHFGRPLDRFEEPQFLRYVPGDYFVAHQDGNTPLIHDDTRFRKVSVVLFLSDRSETPRPGAFGGGALVLHPPNSSTDPPVELAPAPGTLVAFPSETTHEVMPVAHGERLSVVSWYRVDEEA